VTATHQVHVKQHAGRTQTSILRILEAGNEVYMSTTGGYWAAAVGTEGSLPSGENLGAVWDVQAKQPVHRRPAHFTLFGSGGTSNLLRLAAARSRFSRCTLQPAGLSLSASSFAGCCQTVPGNNNPFHRITGELPWNQNVGEVYDLLFCGRRGFVHDGVFPGKSLHL
jgi:hypothetical protein